MLEENVKEEDVLMGREGGHVKADCCRGRRGCFGGMWKRKGNGKGREIK